ncbi:MAG: DnaJ domain-containing protein [Oscillatoriaceae cyanobacterium SKYGB_i_bin93]|nr:DnaJ domain-containing protein [Oscillatoriaceae cyanobacterium SKYGB_i_bin93]
MSFQIDRGLFKFDNFIDYHAILGLPIDADEKTIRKRYLVISRLLHPDSCKAKSEEEKKLASNLFSKLVSPAYSKLSKERERAEHNILLGLIGKRCIQESNKIEIQSEPARQLSQASDYETTYKTLVNQLAEKQYNTLEQSTNIIAELSELNAVYIMRQENKGAVVNKPPLPKPPAPPPPSTKADNKTKIPGAPPPPPPPPSPTTATSAASSSQVDSYYRRAEEFMAIQDFTQAVLQLKDALKIEPKNSRCHALLGMVYLKQNQPTLAKVHIKNALQLNPNEPVALEAQKMLEKPQKPGDKKNKKGNSEQGGGGFFGSLFGGGKKK